jgi:hypothetical protein
MKPKTKKTNQKGRKKGLALDYLADFLVFWFYVFVALLFDYS